MKGKNSYFNSHGYVETPKIDKLNHPFSDFDVCFVLGIRLELIDSLYKDGAIDRTIISATARELGIDLYSYFDLVEANIVMRLRAKSLCLFEARNISCLFLDQIAANLEKSLECTISQDSILEASLISLGLKHSSGQDLTCSLQEEGLIIDLISAFLDANRTISALVDRQKVTSQDEVTLSKFLAV
jgi:hypothetical protein